METNGCAVFLFDCAWHVLKPPQRPVVFGVKKFSRFATVFSPKIEQYQQRHFFNASLLFPLHRLSCLSSLVLFSSIQLTTPYTTVCSLIFCDRVYSRWEWRHRVWFTWHTQSGGVSVQSIKQLMARNIQKVVIRKLSRLSQELLYRLNFISSFFFLLRFLF